MFYAFYSSSESPSLPLTTNAKHTWKGEVELRGLRPGAYKVVDYVNNKDLGIIQGTTAKLPVKFEDNLLLEVTPAAADHTSQSRK